ncbi:MAG: GspH/FimT family pseudopilin [Pseudomonadales bacterium]|nr:GspH/FimT family pseudopilin [Pseudomonadales bacterium]
MTPISGSSAQISTLPSTGLGFTLLELLLVLSIIGLASAFIFPNVGNLDARSFNVQVREANTLLNYARRDAVVRGQPSTVRLIAGEASEDEMESETANLVASWESEEIRLQFLDSTEQITEIEDSIDITFFPEGGSTGGTLMLAYQSQQARILIDPFTGRISNESNEDDD